MALEDVITRRYQGYITIEDLVRMIAREYACSESDALLVLADAIAKETRTDTFSLDTAYPLNLFSKERLGPEKANDRDDILRNLIKNKRKPQEELDGIPF